MQWSSSVRLTRGVDGYEAHVPLPWDSKILYKFIVDGRWVTADAQPTETEGYNVNNVLYTPSRPAAVELASAAAVGAAPGAAAFHPLVASPVSLPPVAADTITTVADTVQAGVAGVIQAAHSLADTFMDRSVVKDTSPGQPANGASAAAPVHSLGEIVAQGEAVGHALYNSAKDKVNGALAQAPKQDELATKALEVANDAKARAMAAVASVQHVVAPVIGSPSSGVEEKVKDDAVSGPKANDFVAPITSPTTKLMPVLPLGVPLANAPEAIGSSVPAALPVEGASTAVAPQPSAGSALVEGPSTHAPINLAASKPPPSAEPTVAITSNQLPKAFPATADTEASVPSGATAMPEDPFVVAGGAPSPREMPSPPAKTDEPASPATTPAPKQMPVVPLGVPLENAPEPTGSSIPVALPVEEAKTVAPVLAEGAAIAEQPSTHAPINLASSKPLTTPVVPDNSDPPIVTTSNQVPVTAPPTTDPAAPEVIDTPAPLPVAPDASKPEFATHSEASPVPAKALEPPSTPPRNGTVTPPTSLPLSANGGSSAVTSPPKTFQQAFPSPDPGTPGSVRSATSSKLTGSIRKKRESFFGKVKDIFKRDGTEEKAGKIHRRQSSLAP
jgi:hypothetical protein